MMRVRRLAGVVEMIVVAVLVGGSVVGMISTVFGLFR